MRIDGPGVSLLDQQRHASRVIDVRVTDDDRVNVLRREREGFAVTAFLIRGPLYQPALEQYLRGTGA